MKHKNVDLSSLQIGILIERLKGNHPFGVVHHVQDPGEPSQIDIPKEAGDLLKYLESEQDSFRPKRSGD